MFLLDAFKNSHRYVSIQYGGHGATKYAGAENEGADRGGGKCRNKPCG